MVGVFKERGEMADTAEVKGKYVENLVRRSNGCMKALRSGRMPTVKQASLLEAALYPFTHYKICGHWITEDCDCNEQQGD